MFERYAPIQRKIKPSLWKNVIEQAILRAKSGETAMDDVPPILPNGTMQFDSRESHKSSSLRTTNNTEDAQDFADSQDSSIAQGARDDQGAQYSQDSQTAPRSMHYWKEHHPARYDLLQRVRSLLMRIAEDTHTPVEVIIKPQIIRNLCWSENIHEVDVSTFLFAQGARAWQVALIAESVTRVIM